MHDVKLFFASVLLLGAQTGAGPTIDLNPTQSKAMLGALGRKGLSRLESVTIAVVPPSTNGIKFDATLVKDAVELELRRSGIKVSERSGDALVFIDVSLMTVEVGGTVRGTTGNVAISVETIGFSDKWESSGQLHLYDDSTLFTDSSPIPQSRLENIAGDEAKKLSLEWLREHTN